MKNGLKRAQAFTMVELLVVIVCVTVLFTLLLPTMVNAREVAIKIACLSNKRQLGVSTISFAADYKLRLPSPIVTAEYTSRTFTPKGYQEGGQPFCGTLSTQFSQGFITAQGALGALGYVQDIRMFYCGGWLRLTGTTPGTNLDRNWYPDAPRNMKDFWIPLTNRGTIVNSGTELYTGCADLWYADLIPGTGYIPGQSGFQYDMSRLDYIELYWNAKCPFNRNSGFVRGSYSPALFCDMNWGSWASGATPNNANCHVYNLIRTGVNCAFYDGSGRWVSREEVMNNTPIYGTNGGSDPLCTDYPLTGAFNRWSRQQLTVSRR